MENVNFIMFNIDELNEATTDLYEAMMDDESLDVVISLNKIMLISKYLKSIYEKKVKERG